MRPLTRRFCLATLSALVLASAATAQTWPEKPIRLVVPFPAGGGTDIVARRLGEHLQRDLGQPVFVDNRAGASGNIGSDAVAKAGPDGYTLLLTAAPFAIAPAVFKALPFDPVRDFTPVAHLANVPLLVVVRAESPLRSIADLVAAAKAKPDSLSYATFGMGTPPHLVGERMQALAGFRMTHVPYKGGQAAMPDLLSGRLDLAIMDIVSMVPQIKAGRLRALAITGRQRAPAVPDVPTLAESGVPFDTVGWYAVFGPAHLPAPVTARLNAAIAKAMTQPDMRTLLADGGSLPVEPAPKPAEWGKAFADNVRVWGDAARAARITLD